MKNQGITILHSPRSWAAGAKLGQRINAEFRSGRATRPALEVERLLSICRRCDQFQADDCQELTIQRRAGQHHEQEAEAANYVELLTRIDLSCTLWSMTSPPGRTPSGARAHSENASRSSSAIAVDAVERVHAQGTTRSQAERREARRKRK